MTEKALSIFQCDFRKKYTIQHALLAMIEKAGKILDKDRTFGALLTNLSKAFDYMTQDLLIAKLQAVNFIVNALNLIFNYLTGRKQGVKMTFSFRSYLDIFGRTNFRISIIQSISLWFIHLLWGSWYHDDKTPYVCSENVDVALEKLEEVGKVLFEFF